MNRVLPHKKVPISLIPYLHPGEHGFSLRLTEPGAGLEAGPAVPVFRVFSELNSFFNILLAGFCEAGTEPLEPVLLLIQKDACELSTVTAPANRDAQGHNERDTNALYNPDIDAIWQTAFSFYTRHHLAPSTVMIPDQVDTQGALVPFHPLWYCRFRGLYFHPLCPVCGELLLECHDDELLIDNGLQPFSASLQRYLYCPCEKKTNNPPPFFYAQAPTEDGPSTLKNLDDMISLFGMLATQDHLAPRLPCAGCDAHAVCFGPEKKAASRLAVFSFFPFYMIVFKISAVFSPEVIGALSEIPGVVTKNSEKKAAPPDATPKPPPAVDVYAAKKDIHRILETLMKKWQATPPIRQDAYNEDFAASSAENRSPAVPDTGEPIAATGDLERTVIISPPKKAAENHPPPTSPLKPLPDLEKTVIITGAAPAADKGKTAKRPIDPGLEKTMIITADAMKKGFKPVSGQKPKPGPSGDDTVILKPDPESVGRRGDRSQNTAPGGNDLEKTVIISTPLKTAASFQKPSKFKNTLDPESPPGREKPSSFEKQSGRTIIFGDDPSPPDGAEEKFAQDESLEKTVIITPNNKLFSNHTNKKDAT